MPISALENFLGGLEKKFSSKNPHFSDFAESEFSTKKSKKCEFFDEKFFQVLLENFLENIWASPRYEKCCCNIPLSNS